MVTVAVCLTSVFMCLHAHLQVYSVDQPDQGMVLVQSVGVVPTVGGSSFTVTVSNLSADGNYAVQLTGSMRGSPNITSATVATSTSSSMCACDVPFNTFSSVFAQATLLL